MTEAQLRLFYERVRAKRDEWRVHADHLRREAKVYRINIHYFEAEQLDLRAADIDAIAKEVGSE